VFHLTQLLPREIEFCTGGIGGRIDHRALWAKQTVNVSGYTITFTHDYFHTALFSVCWDHHKIPVRASDYRTLQRCFNKAPKPKTFRLPTSHCSRLVVAQAVSRRLPTTAARIRAQVRSCGICGGQSGNGVGFLRVFRNHLPLIPPTAPHSSSFIINRGWFNRPNSGRRTKWARLTPPQEKKLRLQHIKATATGRGYRCKQKRPRLGCW
jgi:hypothetical protein